LADRKNTSEGPPEDSLKKGEDDLLSLRKGKRGEEKGSKGLLFGERKDERTRSLRRQERERKKRGSTASSFLFRSEWKREEKEGLHQSLTISAGAGEKT